MEGVDSGSPPRSSVTTLQVNIKDCSSGLMFSEPFYTPTVEENTTVPAIIPTMISVAGGVGPVTYTQLSTTEYQPFNLSSDVSAPVTEFTLQNCCVFSFRVFLLSLKHLTKRKKICTLSIFKQLMALPQLVLL